jgi:hypothetical protein
MSSSSDRPENKIMRSDNAKADPKIFVLKTSKLLRLFVAVAGLSAPVMAQTYTLCRVDEHPPTFLRAGGMSELLDDIIVICTGGTPAIQPMNITLLVNAQITSRILRPNDFGQ